MTCLIVMEPIGKSAILENKPPMENEKPAVDPPVEVRIQKDGPIMIKGIFSFRDSSGKITQGEQELYLCRCGGSASKPWCDDTHKKIGVAH
jgi:hypothetical protein